MALLGFFRRRALAPLVPPAPGQSAYEPNPGYDTEVGALHRNPQRLGGFRDKPGGPKYWGFVRRVDSAPVAAPAPYYMARSSLDFNYIDGKPRALIGYGWYPGLDLRGWNGATMGDVQFDQTLNAPPPYIGVYTRRVGQVASIRQGVTDNQQAAFGRWKLPTLRAPKGSNG